MRPYFDVGSIDKSITHPIPSESAELLRFRKGHGKRMQYSIIMVLNKIAPKPVHGTTIVHHDGLQWSMMNEKHFLKMLGVDHPMASVDDLGALPLNMFINMFARTFP